MIKASSNYQSKITASSRDIKVKSTFGFVDIDAADSAVPAASGEASVSLLKQITNGVTEASKPHLMRLELNNTILDGSSQITGDDNGQVGWWSSSLCNESCIFEPAEAVTFSLPYLANVIGISIYWGEIPREFTLAFYSGSTLKAEKTVSGNKEQVTIIEQPVYGFDKLVISVSENVYPYTRAKIVNVIFGIIKIYTDDEIISMSSLDQIAFMPDALASNEITLEIENFSRDLNPINPQGVIKYLQQKQVISTQLGIGSDSGIEWISIGDMYLYQWPTSSNDGTAKLILRSEVDFIKGTYKTTSIGLVDAKTLLTEIFGKAGITKYIIPDKLASIQLNGFVSEIDYRKAIQLIVNACCHYIKLERDMTLNIKPIVITEPVKTIDYDNIYDKPEITSDSEKGAYGVTVYRYSDGFSTTLVDKMSLGDAGTKSGTIRYSPAVNVSASVTNGTLDAVTYDIDSCYVTVTVKDGATITITGDELYSYEYIVGNADGIVISNPFVATEDVAQKMLEMYEFLAEYRLTYDVKNWRQDMTLEAGDVVKVQNDFYTEQSVMITEQTLRYDGALSGATKGIAKAVEEDDQ